MIVGDLVAPIHWHWQLATGGYHSTPLVLLHYHTAVAVVNSRIEVVVPACTLQAVHSYVSGTLYNVAGTETEAEDMTSHV